MRTYQLCYLKDGQIVPTTYSPRSYESVKYLFDIYTKTWPNITYTISVID